MILAVERFGKPRPERLEIARLNHLRGPKEISREDFCEGLRRILAEQFPDETVEKISIAADLEFSLSRVYAGGISRKGVMQCTFLAVPEGETADAIESSLTYSLLWLERARQTGGRRNLSSFRLILPKGKAGSLAHRLAALNSGFALRVFELDPLTEQIESVDPSGNGNLSSWLVPHRESELLKSRAQGALARIVALAPEAISVHAIPQDQEVVARFRGLPLARWRDERVYFGSDGVWEELTARNESGLKQLVANLRNFRSPLARNTRHMLYRAQSERWLQSLLVKDVSRVDISLDPEHVYEQVFAQPGRQHGVLDLLAVTRTKRLAILELKATENPDLPLQAADYWSRIRRHLAQGDLARYGYFSGMELQATPPISTWWRPRCGSIQ